MFKWNVAYAENRICKNSDIRTKADIIASGFRCIKAEVPGNLELDMMREGIIDDLFYSSNTFNAQKLENLHAWYFTEINMDGERDYLHFAGIDTIADIYVNGELALSTDNMFMEYDVFADYKKGINEIVVHIKPACIETRKYELTARNASMHYNAASLYVRKAAHMFGWDIMPRIVSLGIWRDVTVRQKKEDVIKDLFIITERIDKKDNIARMRFHVITEMESDFSTDYTIRIKGECGDSSFETETIMWHTSAQGEFVIENYKLWWPKNSGEQNLYRVKAELIKNGEVCDEYCTDIGVRTVVLDRTDGTDKDGNGEFCFIINGEKIFVLGTNWVPLDAFHSNDKKRLGKALELLDDTGCNMVRCWGGNVYEDHEFFDFCDRHGIMVWQDFGFGCAIYPNDDAFLKKVEKEAEFIVKKLRNHPSICIWAGDNEVDEVYAEGVYRDDPNKNLVTRKVLKRVIGQHDYTTPYIESSPVCSQRAFDEKLQLPEKHLWGPRDYFKGDFYRNSICHFASETGYHGFPSVKSLETFLENPGKIFNEDGIPTDEYIAHATAMETRPDASYVYRIRLAYSQVETLFGKAEENLEDFVKQSQISQGEAKKYFIERFRLSKWRRTGIIWWNLLDGWPQVSDAVVDYYYRKKLAYHYIKRSQTPVCLMFDEPCDNEISLYAINDFMNEQFITYKITDVTEQKEVLSGHARIGKNSASEIAKLPIEEGEKKFYLIEWNFNGKTYKNHYFTNIIDIDYKEYMEALEKCGFDEFED